MVFDFFFHNGFFTVFLKGNEVVRFERNASEVVQAGFQQLISVSNIPIFLFENKGVSKTGDGFLLSNNSPRSR